MKPLKELRPQLGFMPQEQASQLRYFTRQTIDWNVYLPTKERYLQRGLVWTPDQKRELIYSMLIERHISHCAIINIYDPSDNSKDVWQIIDGKQRLSTMVDFYQNKFQIELEGFRFYFKDLPQDYQRAIEGYHFRYYMVNEITPNSITDQQKINWFKFINFAGTPQDAEHLRSLEL